MTKAIGRHGENDENCRKEQYYLNLSNFQTSTNLQVKAIKNVKKKKYD